MPTGLLPTYDYRPPARPTVPAKLRSCSSRRARLWAGGTYFRAREPGAQGNNISVEIIEFAPHIAPGTGEAYCVVTNSNLKYDENVIGPVTTKVLDLKAAWQDLWIVDQLDTTPRAQYYSISCQIAFAKQNGQPYTLPPASGINRFYVDSLYTEVGKISVKTAKKAASFTPSDRIFIAPRFRIYQLSGTSKTVTDPDSGSSTTSFGWDIANLRTQINTNDPWIEMLERSGSTEPNSLPDPNRPDVQDDGVDADFLSPFTALKLKGGDGLPDHPLRENSGPTRSLVHVNYGELKNGSLGVHNTIYEWAGDNATVGSWKKY